MFETSAKTVTINDLAKAISARARGVSEGTAKALVELICSEIAAAVRLNGDVLLLPLGRFRVVRRVARRGRNPRTGEPLDIPAKTVVTIKPTKWFTGKVFDDGGEDDDNA